MKIELTLIFDVDVQIVGNAVIDKNKVRDILFKDIDGATPSSLYEQGMMIIINDLAKRGEE